MTRIVAGDAGGRRLIVPRGEVTRPTSDRVREALFSALDARGLVPGAKVLDLYAGSGPPAGERPRWCWSTRRGRQWRRPG